MSLPTENDARKALPVFTGNLMYFPLAALAVAEVSRVGNDQHNPGEPLHWAREKSTNQMDTAMRHQIDHGTGNQKDVDGTWHLAKAIWRLSAELQLSMEAAQERGEKVFTGDVPAPKVKGNFSPGARVRHSREGVGTVMLNESPYLVHVMLDSGIAGQGFAGSWRCDSANLVEI